MLHRFLRSLFSRITVECTRPDDLDALVGLSCAPPPSLSPEAKGATRRYFRCRLLKRLAPGCSRAAGSV